MFTCCTEEPPKDSVSTIETAEVAATSENPPAVIEPAEPAKEEPKTVEEKTPEPAPAVEVTASPAGNLVLKIDRSGGSPLGVLLDKCDPNNLVLLKISDGLLKTSAEEAKMDLKAGFRIVKVNGTSAPAGDMVTMLQEKKLLEIELEAFEEKKMKVEKGDKKLGVALGVGKDGTWLTVNKIEAEGAIPDFNAGAAPDQKIKTTDKIISIDGQEAKAEEMIKWIKEKSSMELTVYGWKSLQA
eukprot:TRINITY_DN8333_c0_g4_i2.p1 TRINITY_DN8333_c0_g4~~TRINITY_DN8333_c0_g4_i2.p1  ORF type:complete len:268 (+),score=75.26 TRINITY_DN8333_c0_g4_i2:82-804(+)